MSATTTIYKTETKKNLYFVTGTCQVCPSIFIIINDFFFLYSTILNSVCCDSCVYRACSAILTIP